MTTNSGRARKTPTQRARVGRWNIVAMGSWLYATDGERAPNTIKIPNGNYDAGLELVEFLNRWEKKWQTSS